MITTIMAKGKQDIYLSCGHKIRGNRMRPFGENIVGHLFNCNLCDKHKPLHGKPLKETPTYKANNWDKK